MVCAILLGLVSPAVLRADSPFANGKYVISPVDFSYLALEAVPPGSAAGPAVDLGFKLKASKCEWKLTDTGSGLYSIELADTPSLALTVKGGSSADGASIDLETTKKDTSQLWSFVKVSDGVYWIAPQCSPVSGIDDGGGGYSAGSKVDIWTNDATSTDPVYRHLYWTIKPGSDAEFSSPIAEGTYAISPHDGVSLVLEAAGGSSDPATPVQGAAPNGSASQEWIFKNTGDGYMTVQPAHAKTMAMTVSGAGGTDGTKIVIQPYKPGDPSQKWHIISIPMAAGKGQFAMSPQCALAESLANPGGAQDPGAQMVIWGSILNNSYSWWILKPAK